MNYIVLTKEQKCPKCGCESITMMKHVDGYYCSYIEYVCSKCGTHYKIEGEGSQTKIYNEEVLKEFIENLTSKK